MTCAFVSHQLETIALHCIIVSLHYHFKNRRLFEMMISLTGRYAHRPINPDDPPALKQSRPDHPYRTVGCVFNHKSFYANSQVQELNFS